MWPCGLAKGPMKLRFANTSGAAWRSFNAECAENAQGCLVGILDRGKRTDILVCESGVTGAVIWRVG